MVLVGEPEETRPLGRPRRRLVLQYVDGRIILSWIFMNWNKEHGLD